VRQGLVPWPLPIPRDLPLETRKPWPRTVRRAFKGGFRVTINEAFEDVMSRAATGGARALDHADIVSTYAELHRLGWAHSVEVWWNGNLAGGLVRHRHGEHVRGESMFHRISGASKVAFAAAWSGCASSASRSSTCRS